MAFEKINKSSRGPNLTVEAEVRLGYHLAQSGSKNKTLYIVFTQALIHKLGWPVKLGEKNRQSVSFFIHEGTKEDAGFFMITHDEEGYVAGTNRGEHSTTGQALATSITFSKLQHYVANDPTEEKRVAPCEFVINDDGSLLIQLPDWLRYNGPPADPKPEPVIEEKEAAQVRQSRPTPLKKIAREVVDEVAVEVADDVKLNRTQRRRLAAGVAKALSH